MCVYYVVVVYQSWLTGVLLFVSLVLYICIISLLSISTHSILRFFLYVVPSPSHTFHLTLLFLLLRSHGARLTTRPPSRHFYILWFLPVFRCVLSLFPHHILLLHHHYHHHPTTVPLRSHGLRLVHPGRTLHDVPECLREYHPVSRHGRSHSRPPGRWSTVRQRQQQ